MWTSNVCFFMFIWFYYLNFCFSQLDEIIHDSTLPAYGEAHLGTLTADECTLWTEACDTYFSTGVNRSSLEAIEKKIYTYFRW